MGADSLYPATHGLAPILPVLVARFVYLASEPDSLILRHDLDWQDLQLFVAIVRGGGLASAARETSRSAATLSRRMSALEEAVGERLFERGRAGYSLTESGERLLDHATRMRECADDIERWRAGDTERRRVRISAGALTMRFMVERLTHYWSPQASWVPELVLDHARRDIGRREIDIGVRAGRPEAPWLAGRRIGVVEFAVYQAASLAADAPVALWVAAAAERAGTSSENRIAERHAADMVLHVNSASLGLPLVRQGLARMALPCFVGDACEDLVRVGDALDELRHERWLVVHQDHRHHAHVRAAIEAIAGFFAPDDQAARAS